MKRENYPPYTFSFQKNNNNNNNLLHFWPNRPCPKRGFGYYKLQVENNEFHNSSYLFQTSVQLPIGKNQLIPHVIANNQKNATEAAMNDESILYSDLTGPINSFSFSFYVQSQNCESTTKDPAPFDGFTLIWFWIDKNLFGNVVLIMLFKC